MRPRVALGILVAAALTVPIAALSRAPYSPPDADAAILRYSWRLSESARENCRPRTQEELDALPVHMRTPEVCRRERVTYLLVTRVDSLPADTLHLARGGVKGDRPLFVLEERVLPPGRHRVRVELARASEIGGQSAVAALDTVLNLETGRVRLVTLDAEARRLVVR